MKWQWKKKQRSLFPDQPERTMKWQWEKTCIIASLKVPKVKIFFDFIY